MYVCLCHGINDRQVHAAIHEGGAASTAKVYEHFQVKPQCGKCVPYVHDMVKSARSCGGKGQCHKCHD